MNTDIQPPQPATAPPQPTEAPVAAPPELDEKPQPVAPKKEQPKPTTPPKPKQPGTGVGAAIVATVIIVLGLAALATYAYLKTR
jgi:uncharacterized protein HemX